MREGNNSNNGHQCSEVENIIKTEFGSSMIKLSVSTPPLPQTTIEQKLRLWLSLHQVDCQEIAQVDVLACHNLGDKLSWDRRKSGTNDERLVQ